MSYDQWPLGDVRRQYDLLLKCDWKLVKNGGDIWYCKTSSKYAGRRVDDLDDPDDAFLLKYVILDHIDEE